MLKVVTFCTVAQYQLYLKRARLLRGVFTAITVFDTLPVFCSFAWRSFFFCMTPLEPFYLLSRAVTTQLKKMSQQTYDNPEIAEIQREKRRLMALLPGAPRYQRVDLLTRIRDLQRRELDLVCQEREQIQQYNQNLERALVILTRRKS